MMTSIKNYNKILVIIILVIESCQGKRSNGNDEDDNYDKSDADDNHKITIKIISALRRIKKG